jgi:urease accessory protein
LSAERPKLRQPPAGNGGAQIQSSARIAGRADCLGLPTAPTPPPGRPLQCAVKRHVYTLKKGVAGLLVLSEIVGQTGDPEISRRLHELGHSGKVEYITLSREDALRHRLRVVTDRGTECAVVLKRSVRIFDSAVLLLEQDRAIVTRLSERTWLSLAPRDVAAALELGYHAGNSHWTVRFDGPVMRIALEGSEQSYLDRLAAFFSDHRVTRADDDQ